MKYLLNGVAPHPNPLRRVQGRGDQNEEAHRPPQLNPLPRVQGRAYYNEEERVPAAFIFLDNLQTAIMHQAVLKSRQSIVLLGASNLTIGWRSVLNSLRHGLDTPLDVFVALGMGRSYVDWSRFAGRELPGIARCQLFDDFAAAVSTSASRTLIVGSEAEVAPAPLVLMTDVGNDLVYGRTPEVIAASLEICLERIRQCSPHSKILMTGLPLSSVTRLTNLRYVVTRSLLFPGCRLQLPLILQRAAELDVLVRNIAAARNAIFVEPLDQWYGIDPIHIRRPLRQGAFQYLFSQWPGFGFSDVAISSDVAVGRNMPIPALPAVAEKRSFGRKKSVNQPYFTSDQLTIFGY